MTDLFDFAADMARAHARRTDPETSREAADSITGHRISRLHGDILNTLLVYGPMTDERLCSLYGDSPSSVRSRRAELVAMGYVRQHKNFGQTKRGRRAILWEVAP